MVNFTLLRKREKTKKVKEDDALAELGINILTSVRLDNRLDVIKVFLEDLESSKYDSNPDERVDLMKKVVEQAIIPYLAGRDNPNVIKLIDAWGRILSFYYFISKNDEIREKYLDTINDITKNEIYRDFLLVLTVGFSESDLAKNLVAVIQSIENIVPQAIPLAQRRIGE
jgi:hypothetical protein